MKKVLAICSAAVAVAFVCGIATHAMFTNNSRVMTCGGTACKMLTCSEAQEAFENKEITRASLENSCRSETCEFAKNGFENGLINEANKNKICPQRHAGITSDSFECKKLRKAVMFTGDWHNYKANCQH